MQNRIRPVIDRLHSNHWFHLFIACIITDELTKWPFFSLFNSRGWNFSLDDQLCISRQWKPGQTGSD